MKSSHKTLFFSSILFCFFLQNSFIYFDLPGSHSQRLNENEYRGLKVWRKSGCMYCHQFYGQGGFMGPDLTNVVKRVDFEALSTRLDMGGYRMPAFHLSEKEKTELYAYLQFMDKTGQGTLNSFTKKSELPWYEYEKEEGNK